MVRTYSLFVDFSEFFYRLGVYLTDIIEAISAEAEVVGTLLSFVA